MKIATREERISTTINYNDGSTKNIENFKVYVGHMKTPSLNYKIVEFRDLDGEIDTEKSYSHKITDVITGIDDSDPESDSDYKSGSEEESEEESDEEESEEESDEDAVPIPASNPEQFALPEPKVNISKRKKYAPTAKMIKFWDLDNKTKHSFIDIRKKLITYIITNMLNNSETINIDKKMTCILGFIVNTTMNISDLDNIVMQFYS